MSPELQLLFQLIKFRLGEYSPSEENEEMPNLPEVDSWHLPVREFVKNKTPHP